MEVFAACSAYSQAGSDLTKCCIPPPLNPATRMAKGTIAPDSRLRKVSVAGVKRGNPSKSPPLPLPRRSISDHSRKLQRPNVRSAPEPEAPSPAQAVLGAPTRLVLAADPALVAEPVERIEDRRIVDLALIRLGTRRHGRDLHVPGQRQEFLETLQEVAADDLDVIEIELDAHIRPVDLGDQIRRLLDPRDEIIRPVARIERLDQ